MTERILILVFSFIGLLLTINFARRHPFRRGLMVPVALGLLNYFVFYSLVVGRAMGYWEVGIPLLNAMSRLKDLYTVFIVVGILWYER